MAIVQERLQSIEERIGQPVVREAELGKLAVLRKLKIVSASNDHVVCNPYDADNDATGTDTVNVAKPFELRHTPFHGATIAYPDGNGDITYSYSSQRARTASRTIDGDTLTETQIVIPDYWVGDIIVAARSLIGGTGVTVSGTVLVWEDINTAGRMWARE